MLDVSVSAVAKHLIYHMTLWMDNCVILSPETFANFHPALQEE